MSRTIKALLFLVLAGCWISPASNAYSSQVTIEKIYIAPDYSSSSQQTPATLRPLGTGSSKSNGSVNGRTGGDFSAGPAHNPKADPTGPNAGIEKGPLPQILRDLNALPIAVQRMHEALYQATQTGDLEALRLPVEMNEMPPSFGLDTEISDPVAQIISMSGDAEGFEILAILSEILESGFVHVDKGTPQEMYVWPYFALYPTSRLTAQQRVEMFRLLTAGDFEEMEAQGYYSFFRLGIGPDGTWHYFYAGE